MRQQKQTRVHSQFYKPTANRHKTVNIISTMNGYHYNSKEYITCGEDRVALYEKIWSKGVYNGFSRGTTGAEATLFLDKFISSLKKGHWGDTIQVAEFGAGSGDHSLRLWQEGADVVAIESSKTAASLMKARFASSTFKNLKVVGDNTFTYFTGAQGSSFHGIYANAVVHFFTASERKELYTDLFRSLKPGGVLALSFKGTGDSLQKRGLLVEDTPAGPIVEGAEDGVPRLYVNNPAPLIHEMTNVGFIFGEEVEWTIPDYNVVGEDGVFVGLIAYKP